MAQDAVANKHVTIRMACAAFCISETCYLYQPVNDDENAQIADLLVDLTDKESDWGVGQCFYYLRNVKGFGWNHKRVYRIYCDLAATQTKRP
jgi:putative transposase